MKMLNARSILTFYILVCLSPLSLAAERGVRLINGKPVEAGTYKEVIKISTNGAACTATVVGPRVIITAAHCANNDATSTFTIDGVQYSAKMKRSSLYPGKDHDIALGVTTQDINVKPAAVGGKANVGLSLTLLGFGCINPGGTGGNDGVLRVGDTVITSVSDLEMVSRKADGAALCFGDSGGPGFLVETGKKTLIGINSKGNIKDTNWNARLDSAESIDFMKTFAQQNSVTICGVNGDCGGGPQPGAPTCQLAASPKVVKVGQSVTLAMLITGQATSATIENQNVPVANPQLVITTTSEGMFTAKATVTGQGGSNTCQDTYEVKKNDPQPQVPTCTLSAIPSTVKLGEVVTLELNTSGNADRADIDGTAVPIPLGKKMVTTTQKGTFNSRASVSGPGGSNTCWASYTVDEGGGPGPNTPNLAIVPTYCGDNTLPTQIRKVCLAIIKKDSKMMDLRVTEAIVVSYQDQSREVMPIISRRMKPKSGADVKVQEDLTMYANTSLTVDNYQVLDSREALLTRMPPNRDGEIPSSLEGRSAKGQYFIVEKLAPYAVSK